VSLLLRPLTPQFLERAAQPFGFCLRLLPRLLGLLLGLFGLFARLPLLLFRLLGPLLGLFGLLAGLPLLLLRPLDCPASARPVRSSPLAGRRQKVPELFVAAVGWRAAMAMSQIEARILEEADPRSPSPAGSGGLVAEVTRKSVGLVVFSLLS
jgi:hypothetical protein